MIGGMQQDYRYTDRDVRENPELMEAALQFVSGYGGDFEFLVAARQSAAEAGSLPVPFARGVLNCMRTDISGISLLRVTNARIALREPEQEIEPFSPHVRQHQPRYPVDLKVRWRLPYIMSTHPKAELVHILSSERSSIRYWPARDEYQWMPKAYCSHHFWYTTKYLLTREVPGGRRLCARCVAQQEKEQQKAA